MRQRRLIRYGECPGWSESLLGAHLFVGFVMSRLKLKKFPGSQLSIFSDIFKQFSFQTYLSLQLPKSKTNELTKLRISAHNLTIERGRHQRPKLSRENCICLECNSAEDGTHFMLFCKKYDDKRKELFEKVSLSDQEPSSELSSKFFFFFFFFLSLSFYLILKLKLTNTHVFLVNDFIKLHT